MGTPFFRRVVDEIGEERKVEMKLELKDPRALPELLAGAFNSSLLQLKEKRSGLCFSLLVVVFLSVSFNLRYKSSVSNISSSFQVFFIVFLGLRLDCHLRVSSSRVIFVGLHQGSSS